MRSIDKPIMVWTFPVGFKSGQSTSGVALKIRAVMFLGKIEIERKRIMKMDDDWNKSELDSIQFKEKKVRDTENESYIHYDCGWISGETHPNDNDYWWRSPSSSLVTRNIIFENHIMCDDASHLYRCKKMVSEKTKTINFITLQ